MICHTVCNERKIGDLFWIMKLCEFISFADTIYLERYLERVLKQNTPTPDIHVVVDLFDVS